MQMLNPITENLVGAQVPRRLTTCELKQLNEFLLKEKIHPIGQPPIIVPYHSMSYGSVMYRSQMFKLGKCNSVAADFQVQTNKQTTIRTYFGNVKFYFAVKVESNTHELACCQWIHQTKVLTLGQEVIPIVDPTKLYKGDAVVKLSQIKSRVVFIPLFKVNSKYQQQPQLCSVIDMHASIVDDDEPLS